MYTAKVIIDRIKSLADNKGIDVGDILLGCGIDKGVMTTMLRGHMPKVKDLAEIADYLQCSVDYLLGRVVSKAKIYNPNNNVINSKESIELERLKQDLIQEIDKGGNIEEILNELEQNLKYKNDKDTNYYSIFIDNESNKETEQEFFHVIEELKGV